MKWWYELQIRQQMALAYIYFLNRDHMKQTHYSGEVSEQCKCLQGSYYHRVFHAICKYYRVSPTTYIIFPFDEYRVSLWFLQPFSINIAGKTYGHTENPCTHLQCTLFLEKGDLWYFISSSCFLIYIIQFIYGKLFHSLSDSNGFPFFP